MKARPLADELRRLVGRHGFKAVNLELRTLKAEQGPTGQQGRGVQAKAGRNVRVNATEYVRKLDVDADKRPAVLALAKQFDAKRFLPTCAEIRNFCAIYDIDPPASNPEQRRYRGCSSSLRRWTRRTSNASQRTKRTPGPPSWAHSPTRSAGMAARQGTEAPIAPAGGMNKRATPNHPSTQ